MDKLNCVMLNDNYFFFYSRFVFYISVIFRCTKHLFLDILEI